MTKGRLRTIRAAGPLESDPAESSPYCLDIEIDEREGLLRIYDPRAFENGRAAFCRRMLDAAAARPGFEMAEIDLARASCLLKFDRRSATAWAMAEALSTAVHQAAARVTAADRPRWWRPGSRFSALTAYRTPDGISMWETIDEQPGRIRLRHEAISGDRARLAQLADALAGLEGIEDCRLSTWSHTLTLDLRPEEPIAGRLLDAVEGALRDWKAAGAIRSHPGGDGEAIEVATGTRRLMYLALAGGSFAMTLVGLVVPGIPTVPFLLTTSYYLSRSSRRLDERLRRTRLFGPIVVEWEQRHGLSRSSKLKLVGLTLTIVVVTVALTPISPVALLVIVLISSLSIYGIAGLRGLPEEAREASPIDGRMVPALPAP
jgi:uncharacterized membrane protein YbaN (DUF454 family)